QLGCNLVHRDALLKLGEPVQHNPDWRRDRSTGLRTENETEEVLTIRRDIVAPHASRPRIVERVWGKSFHGFAKAEAALVCNANFLGSTTRPGDKEEFLSIGRPQRIMIVADPGDLILRSGHRERLDENVRSVCFRGLICQPLSVGRKDGPAGEHSWRSC